MSSSSSHVPLPIGRAEARVVMGLLLLPSNATAPGLEAVSKQDAEEEEEEKEEEDEEEEQEEEENDAARDDNILPAGVVSAVNNARQHTQSDSCDPQPHAAGRTPHTNLSVLLWSTLPATCH
jgi:hypothetical protein